MRQSCDRGRELDATDGADVPSPDTALTPAQASCMVRTAGPALLKEYLRARLPKRSRILARRFPHGLPPGTSA